MKITTQSGLDAGKSEKPRDILIFRAWSYQEHDPDLFHAVETILTRLDEAETRCGLIEVPPEGPNDVDVTSIQAVLSLSPLDVIGATQALAAALRATGNNGDLSVPMLLDRVANMAIEALESP